MLEDTHKKIFHCLCIRDCSSVFGVEDIVGATNLVGQALPTNDVGKVSASYVRGTVLGAAVFVGRTHLFTNFSNKEKLCLEYDLRSVQVDGEPPPPPLECSESHPIRTHNSCTS